MLTEVQELVLWLERFSLRIYKVFQPCLLAGLAVVESENDLECHNSGHTWQD